MKKQTLNIKNRNIRVTAIFEKENLVINNYKNNKLIAKMYPNKQLKYKCYSINHESTVEVESIQRGFKIKNDDINEIIFVDTNKKIIDKW